MKFVANSDMRPEKFVAISDKIHMRLTYSPSALRVLRKAPAREMAALRAKLQEVAADPHGQHPWAKRLTDQPGDRVRQGDRRAVYRLDHTTEEMIVDIIAKRDEVYK